MDEREKLQRQMHEIGDRYLRRTVGEMARLQELLQQMRGGVGGALQDIRHMAHKIHGSGAMFGFDAVSDSARELELLVAAPGGSDLVARLETCIASLEEQVRAAARTRGIQ